MGWGWGDGPDDSWDWDETLPAEWWQEEADMFFNLAEGDPAMLTDPQLQMLFDAGYFDQGITPMERHDAREALAEYLADHYGVDFGSAFDWEAYREWYAGASAA